MSWDSLGDWWLEELARDDAYSGIVAPLLIDVLQPELDATYLDVGAGEGHVAALVKDVGAKVIGLDLVEDLLWRFDGLAVRGDALSVPLRAASVDGAFAVLVLDHLADHGAFFSEMARVVRPSGVLAVVSNHPVWTAPGSTPIEDSDGEVLWRPGEYFETGHTDVEVKGGVVRFYHRSMADILNTAADVGWSLEQMIEQPHHELSAQASIPRLVACRWRLP